MWEIVYFTRFKKDLKRYKGQPDRIKDLKAVLQQLRDNGKVDASYKPLPILVNKLDNYEEIPPQVQHFTVLGSTEKLVMMQKYISLSFHTGRTGVYVTS